MRFILVNCRKQLRLVRFFKRTLLDKVSNFCDLFYRFSSIMNLRNSIEQMCPLVLRLRDFCSNKSKKNTKGEAKLKITENIAFTFQSWQRVFPKFLVEQRPILTKTKLVHSKNENDNHNWCTLSFHLKRLIRYSSVYPCNMWHSSIFPNTLQSSAVASNPQNALFISIKLNEREKKNV